MLNKTPASSNIALDDFDPSSKWVVETQAPVFDNEYLSWLDLNPPSGPGESSGAQNPTSKEDEEEEDEDDDEEE